MAKATTTTNPLHFEDLEPHRFEDLVRQLIYDFRNWRKLEATGRLGGDQGFDIRGWETSESLEQENEDAELEDTLEKPIEDRVWLIQCKREKSVTPKKLIAYLDNISVTSGKTIHGLIFVAASDFSKKSRDDFKEWCLSHHINERRSLVSGKV